jgi:hypothetical protein
MCTFVCLLCDVFVVTFVVVVMKWMKRVRMEKWVMGTLIAGVALFYFE